MQKIINWGRFSLLLIAANLLIYSNSLAGEFVFDDSTTIVNNFLVRYYRNLQLLWQTYPSRFLPMLSFSINYQLAGMTVWWYHLVNLILHILNGFLVYIFVSLLQKTPEVKKSILKNWKVLPFLTALLFTVHPIQTAAVSYISQRITLLGAFFFLTSLIFYIKARFVRNYSDISANSQWRYLIYLLLSLLTGIFAFISKENTFVLPLVVALIEVCFFSQKISEVKNKALVILPYFLLTIAIFILVSTVSGKISFSEAVTSLPPIMENTTVTRNQYLLTQINVIRTYVKLLLVPINQNVDYDYPLTNNFWEITTVLSFIFLLSFLVLAVKIYKKHRQVSFGIFFFFLTLSIESSIFPITDVIFEHRLYLPSVGFFLAVSCIFFLIINNWDKHHEIQAVNTQDSVWKGHYFILIVIILWLSILTYQRNKVWRNEYTLWTDVVTKSPKKARAHYNLAVSLGDLGKFEQAQKEFEKTLNLNPEYTSAYYNLAAIYEMNSDYPKAIEMYRQVLRLEPDNLKVQGKLKILGTN